jgi:soluble lytic murein transglycosylase
MKTMKYSIKWAPLVIAFLTLGLGQEGYSDSRKPITEKTIPALVTQSQALSHHVTQEARRASLRWKHAKELLGKQYVKSIVKSGERVTTVDAHLEAWLQKELKQPWKYQARQISKTILQVSEQYGFDPIFLLALIKNESRFNPIVIGKFGEIGLMQVIPRTGEWIAKKYHLPWKGAESLKNPVTNIQIGSAYIAYLKGRFASQSQLYISAYNMGSTNVRRALERHVEPKEYRNRVMNHYMHYYADLKLATEKHIASL